MPVAVGRLVDELADVPGVEAVVLGGSRAVGTATSASDWDLGVFYRGTLDLRVLESRGEVHRPGSWGRLMNGGAWLDIDGLAVDVLLRDLDVVETWSAAAQAGDYEVDQLLGYVAGFATYFLVGEVAVSRVLRGSLAIDTKFGDALGAVAVERWRFQRNFSLDYAHRLASTGQYVAALGNLARATLEEAHRRMCSRHAWVVNEKRLLADAGLAALNDELGRSPHDVHATIGRVAELLVD